MFASTVSKSRNDRAELSVVPEEPFTVCVAFGRLFEKYCCRRNRDN
jgi:hypothetical protein